MRKFLLICFNKNAAGPAITLSMAKSLIDRGDRVYCVLSSQINNKKQWLRITDRANIIFLDSGDRKRFICATLKLFFRYRTKLKKFFLSSQIDYSIQVMAHPWGSIINKWAKCKIATVICHDPIPHEGDSIINILFSKLSYKMADCLWVLSEKYISLAEKRYKKKTYFMRHGLFNCYKLIKRKHFYPYDVMRVNFLFFGRIEPYKGLDVILRTMKKLIRHYDNVHLTIAGSGNIDEYSNEIGDLRNFVTVYNRYIDDNEIECFFDKKYNVVVVLPYIEATQSGVIPIAIDYQIPIIATRTGALIEQLDNGKLGILAESNSVDSLYDACVTFIENKELYAGEQKKMIEYGKKLDWGYQIHQVLSNMEKK